MTSRVELWQRHAAKIPQLPIAHKSTMLNGLVPIPTVIGLSQKIFALVKLKLAAISY